MDITQRHAVWSGKTCGGGRFMFQGRRARICVGWIAMCLIVHVRTGYSDADIVLSRLVANQNGAEWSSVSPDGTLLSFTASAGTLNLRNLRTGAIRQLTRPTTPAFTHSPMWAVFSRDGKEIAYYLANLAGGGSDEIRTMRLDGSGDRLLVKNPGRWTQLADWSPDGTHLLAVRTASGNNSDIVLISTRDGAVSVLAHQSTFAGRPFFSTDGRWIAHDGPQESGDEYSDVWLLSADGKEDRPVVRHRGNDTVVGWSADGRTLLFASDRTGSTGIWEVPIENGSARGGAELVKADVGRLRYPLGITRSGSVLFAVDAKHIDVFLVRLDLARGTAAWEPEPPTQHSAGGNSYPYWSPDGNSFVYLSSPDIGGRSVAQLYTHDSQEAERGIAPMLSWFNRPEWLPSGSIAVTGGDKSGHEGIYGIDVSTGEAMQLLDRTENETAFHGQWTKDGHTYFGRHQKAADGVYRLDLRTHQKWNLYVPREGWQARGSVLSPDEKSLALEIAPNAPTDPSKIILIDVLSGEARELFSNSAPTTFPCCRPLTWTSDSRHLVVAAGDARERKMILVNLDGSPAKTLLSKPGLTNPSLNRDDTRLLVESGESNQEIWQLESATLKARAKHRD